MGWCLQRGFFFWLYLSHRLEETIPALTASPHLISAPNPKSFFYSFVGFFPGQQGVSCIGEQSRMQHSKSELTKAQERRRIISLSLVAAVFSMQPRRLFALFAARAHCWLMISMVSFMTHRSFPANPFP